MSETIDLATVQTVTSPSGLSLIGLNGSGQLQKIKNVLIYKGTVDDLDNAFTMGVYQPTMNCINGPSGYSINNSDVVVCFSIGSSYSIQFLISLNDERIYRRSKRIGIAPTWSMLKFTPIS